MTKNEIAKARRLCDMASDGNISYEPEGEAQPRRDCGSVWYPVVAESSTGQKWSYWLAADSGSYKGSFPW